MDNGERTVTMDDDDKIADIELDLELAYLNGVTRATKSFCKALCKKHGVSSVKLIEIIEEWNLFPDDDQYDILEKLHASLETGCSRMETDGNYPPEPKIDLGLVKNADF